jgi:diaminopimelate decarboxylase
METGATVEETIRSYKQRGSAPFCAYIYDLKQLRKHIEHLRETLPAQCRLFYAMKANSERPVLQTLHHHVDGFEVASIGEMETVRELDTVVPVCFGGPGKTDEELEWAIKHKVELIHVESMHELRRLHHIAGRFRTNVSILLRVNVESIPSEAKLKMAGVPSQFGMEEKRIPALIEEVQKFPSIKLKGFHFHAMSNNLDARTHLEFISDCLERVQRWERQTGITVEHINAGGGIGINYASPERSFDWAQFAAGLHGLLDGVPYTLTLEPGRYIAAESGYYAAEVLDIKENHGKHFAVIRGGTHHLRLPAAWKMSHPFTVIPIEEWPYPFERPEVRDKPLTVAGELCTPNDVLVRDVPVRHVRAGDIVLFSHAGAYGWVISHHDFLQHPHPDKLFLSIG